MTSQLRHSWTCFSTVVPNLIDVWWLNLHCWCYDSALNFDGYLHYTILIAVATERRYYSTGRYLQASSFVLYLILSSVYGADQKLCFCSCVLVCCRLARLVLAVTCDLMLSIPVVRCCDSLSSSYDMVVPRTLWPVSVSVCVSVSVALNLK